VKTLFCLPGAGGTANSFYQWTKISSPEIRIVPVEYAGHGRRKDSYYTNISDALKDIYTFIDKECGFENYSIFGHSMGASIAYNLVRYIKENNKPLPHNLFLAGAVPPDIRFKKKLYTLPDERLIKKVKRKYNISAMVLADKEMVGVIMNNIRADEKMMQTYRYISGETINIDGVYILVGRRDLINCLTYKMWRKYTVTSPINKFFHGNHFFLHRPEVIRYIIDVLEAN